MIALARERGVAGRSVEAALALTKAAAEIWGKPLPMNVSMTIAATLRDVDVPAGLIRAAPILARTAGLIAHCIEEAETPIGFLMASKGEEAIVHAADADESRLMAMVEPEIERRRGRIRRDSDAAALSQADRISVRAVALLSRQARARRIRHARRRRRPRGDRRRCR